MSKENDEAVKNEAIHDYPKENAREGIRKRPSRWLVEWMILQYFEFYKEGPCYPYLTACLLKAKQNRNQRDEKDENLSYQINRKRTNKCGK